LLYKRHGGTVFRYAWHLLGRREDAEDATQATFLAVHGALASGTAVLEPGAWVLRIARNECMGRLRQTARRPALSSLDDGFELPAPGSVEWAAELRDEMRTARETLSCLPVAEREAFVLREWIGLEMGEVALALGLTTGDVEWLTARARRSLVLAVGGLEPAVGCAGTRAALEAGTLDRAGKVHLLRCPVCRGVRRALRPPAAGRKALAPAGVVAEQLANALPGFASGGGGIVAAFTAKAAAVPIATKAAAMVAAALVAGGAVEQTIRTTQPAHQGTHGGRAQASLVASRTTQRAAIAPAATQRGSAAVAFATHTSPTRTTMRGGIASPAGRQDSSGSQGSGGDHHGSTPGNDHGAGNGSGTGNAGNGGDHNGGDVRSGSAAGDHASSDGAHSSGTGTHSGGDEGSGHDAFGGSRDSASGDGGLASSGDHAGGDSSASGSGHDSGGTTPAVAQTHGGDDGESPAPVDTQPPPTDLSTD
jgi:RNA polymerase sigma factor (sigma-70 family)